MKYLGNQPSIEIVQSYSDKWDYIQPTNPAVDTNPSSLYAKWLNSSTGEEFICTDNTTDINIWIGHKSPVPRSSSIINLIDSPMTFCNGAGYRGIASDYYLGAGEGELYCRFGPTKTDYSATEPLVYIGGSGVGGKRYAIAIRDTESLRGEIDDDTTKTYVDVSLPINSIVDSFFYIDTTTIGISVDGGSNFTTVARSTSGSLDQEPFTVGTSYDVPSSVTGAVSYDGTIYAVVLKKGSLFSEAERAQLVSEWD